MPKIFGSSLLAIVSALLLFYMVGFLFYGILFSEQWLSMAGISKAEATARSEGLGAMIFVWGLLITLVQVLGISAIMNKSGANSAGAGIATGAMLAILIALPVMAYRWLYEGSSAGLLGMDLCHILLGYCITGAVLGFFRRGKQSH